MVEEISIFEKKIHPLKQSIGVLIIVFVLQGGYKLINSTNEEINTGFFWEVAFAMTLFYALMNAILSFAQDDRTRYWIYSFVGYILLFAGSIGLAFLFSGASMESAGTYRWFIFLFTFVYLILIAIVNSVRTIILIAQKQDARLRGEE